MSPDQPPRVSSKPTLEDLLSPLGVPEVDLGLLSPDDIAAMLSRVNAMLKGVSKAIATTEAKIKPLQDELTGHNQAQERIAHAAIVLWQLQQSQQPF